jgi:hypothetical protein
MPGVLRKTRGVIIDGIADTNWPGVCRRCGRCGWWGVKAHSQAVCQCSMTEGTVDVVRDQDIEAAARTALAIGGYEAARVVLLGWASTMGYPTPPVDSEDA